MSEVHMPAEEATVMAQRLLAAAEELGLPASVVQTSSSGVFGLSFLVPDEVFNHMVDTLVAAEIQEPEPEPELEPEPEPVVKKKTGRPKKAVPVAEEVTDGE